MQFELSPECPIFTAGSEVHLISVLERVQKGWHSLVSPDPYLLRDLVSENVWALFGDYLLTAYKSAANGPSAVGPSECRNCSPERLSGYFHQPTRLIVENGTNDGDFVQVVARILRPRLKSRFDVSSSPLEILNGGGIGEVPKEIARWLPRHKANHVDGFPLRLIILVDSDSKAPGEVSEQARFVDKFCRRTGVGFHILEKRSIENYIPDRVFEEYAWEVPEMRERADEIVRLSPAARDHYPIKDGLHADTSKSTESEYLYPGVPREIGMGDNFAHVAVSKYERAFDRAGLRIRDYSGDLDRLLDLLESNV